MPHELHVGICGAGIGGLYAAIAIRKAGARVTVLEAADELSEARHAPPCRISPVWYMPGPMLMGVLVQIGAGIQMTPNAARLLQRLDVDRAIGKNLV
jgi:salicylate hydroxylase